MLMKNLLTPDGTTKLLSLFGQHPEHSPSPATHTFWAQQSGLNIHYCALAVETPDAFTALAESLMRSPNFLGANITNPFKRDALGISGAACEASAASCGAANTLFRKPAGHSYVWTLANTDLDGCSESVEKILSKEKQNDNPPVVVILGAGAMMQTMQVALENTAAKLNVNLTVFVAARRRTPEFESVLKGTLSSKHLNVRFLNLTEPDWHRAAGSASAPEGHLLCINTLPAGTSAGAERVVLDCIRLFTSEFPQSKKSLFCVSYGDKPWHRAAKDLNWAVLNGNLLFEIQARASFKLWTGCVAPNLPTALPPT